MPVKQNAASRNLTRGPGAATLELRDVILRRVLAIDSQAAPWTVRQVFYAMTVAGVVAKSEAGYDRVQRQVLALRRTGALPYDRIADATRWVRRLRTFSSLADWVEWSTDALRCDLWRDSGDRVEIWCEKDALAGVIADTCYRWHVPLFVARGYASETYLHEAALAIADDARRTAIYHVGDLDPSGVDAADKIRDRLAAFVADLTGDESAQRVSFTRLAVTPEQVREWHLPSRPTKRTDTRSASFARRFGDIASTELDALTPAQLCGLIEGAILRHVDPARVARIEAEERDARSLAVQIAECYRAS